jgi:anti-sigma regulatory factor (Ser/Thr protein kinase)
LTAREENATDRRGTPRFSARFPGTLAAFEAAFAQLRRALDEEPLDAESRFSVELVFEEIVANIVRYATPTGGQAEVFFSLHVEGDSAILTFDDNGVPFDPRDRLESPRPKSLDQATIGGLGIAMVRRAASAIDYRRTSDQRNRLIVTVPILRARNSI